MRKSGGSLVALVLCASPAQAKSEDFSLKSQPLSRALVALAVQANISIATGPEGLSKVESQEVRGKMSVEDALTLLLQNSGYTFQRVDAAAYAITKAPAIRSEAASSVRTDIIVTASMRPQALNSAAVAVSSIPQEDIQRAGISGAKDVAFNTAGMIVTNLGPGRDKIFLRGVSDGAFSGRTQSTIGVYLDDIRLTYGAPDPDLSLADTSSVEVLRGPQGMRFGAGSIGGIYRIISNKPARDSYAASISATAISVEDGVSDNSYEAMVNLPLFSGRGAVRAVAYRDVAPGWLDNPGLGLKNSNSTKRTGGRLSSIVQLSDTWSLGFEGIMQGIASRDSQYVGADNPEQTRSVLLREPHDNDFELASVTVRGALPFAEFSSTSSVAAHNIDSIFDATGTLTALGLGADSLARFSTENKLKFFTEELKLRSAASHFPWAMGAFVSYGDADVTDGAIDLVAPQRAVYEHLREDNVHEFAIFGEATYSITSSLSVTAGARWYMGSLDSSAETTRALLGQSDSFSGKRSVSRIAPKFEIAYQRNADAFYYALASQGYRTGGFNSGGSSASLLDGPLQPIRRYGGDELWNYEIGLKRRLWSGRVNIRAASYAEIWEGVQSDQLLADGLPFAGNVGNAKILGSEAEVALQLTRNWRSQLSFSVTDSEVTSPNATFPAAKDDALPGAPAVSAGAAIMYDRQLTDTLTLSADLRGQYIGHSSIRFTNERATEIGGYSQFNLRVGLSSADWSITASLENTLDERGATFSYGNPLRFGIDRLVTPLSPRSIGLTLRKSFQE